MLVSSYMDKQIKLEEKFYDELYSHIDALIALLVYNMESKEPNRDRVISIRDRFISQTTKEMSLICLNHAKDCTNLVKDTIFPDTQYVTVMQTLTLGYQFANGVNNLIHGICGRFLEAIPIGLSLLYMYGTKEYLDEETIHELKTRSTNALKRFVQTSTTQAVSNCTVGVALAKGFTEYIGDNMHDDRVREQHRIDNDGHTWHSLTRPPKSGLPGSDFRCRCIYKEFR